MYVPGSYTASSLLIEDNTIYSRATHVNSGATSILINNYGQGSSTIVRNNTLSAAGGRLAGAINVSNSSSVSVSLIEGNTISGYTNSNVNAGYGIFASSGNELVVRNNLITGGNNGIQITNGVAQNNRVQNMTNVGILARSSTTQVVGNTITGGPVGIPFRDQRNRRPRHQQSRDRHHGCRNQRHGRVEFDPYPEQHADFRIWRRRVAELALPMASTLPTTSSRPPAARGSCSIARRRCRRKRA